MATRLTTDADEDKPNDQPFSFKVDDSQASKVRTARTGIGYEPGEGEFKRSRSWIALNFENVTKADEFEGGPDRIDAGSVDGGRTSPSRATRS